MNLRDRVVLGLLLALVVLLGLIRAAALPLWSDELATLHLAQAPNWRQMLAWSHQVDLNPPLEPALVRLSTRIFGAHELGARVPSVLAFAAAIGAMFHFLRRRVALPYALFGALLPLCSPEVSYYLTEARPYALLFAGVAVAALAYDYVIAEQRPTSARVVLAVALLCTLQSHLFGALAAGAFVIAEVVRSLRLRRFDVLTWTAILLPFLSCITYLPVLHAQSAPGSFPMIYEEKDRTSLRKGIAFYHSFLYLPLAPLLKAVVAVLLCTPFFPSRSPARWLRFTPETWAWLASLLATPVLVAIVFHLRAPASGFFPRYSIATVVPAFLLLAGLAAWRAGDHLRAGWLLAAVSIVAVLYTFSNEPDSLRSALNSGFVSIPRNATETAGVEQICPHLPLVINDALDFFEDDYRLGTRMADRMVYVTDPARSLLLERDTALESVAGMARTFQIPHRVVPSAAFLAQHQQFLVLSHIRHNDWFLDAMQAGHARIVDLGNRLFAANKDRLWYVATDPATPVPACITVSAARP